MKYFLSNIAILTYLVGLFGWQVNKHYSGGELFDIKLFVQAESCCEDNCDCCDDTTDIYQLDTDHAGGQQLKVETPVFDLQILFVDVQLHEPHVEFFQSYDVRPPPMLVENHSAAFLQSFRC